eukprot:135343-Chlamydomonas_euryale.AAC.2
MPGLVVACQLSCGPPLCASWGAGKGGAKDGGSVRAVHTQCVWGPAALTRWVREDIEGPM